MAIAKRLRRQAATCAALAKQTHDEDGRQRYLRLEQTYRKLIETEERAVRPTDSADRQSTPAA